MNRKVWTPQEKELLTKKYPVSSTRELAEMFARSVGSVYNMAFLMGLKKTRDFIAYTARENILNPAHGGRKSLFPKGHKPFNKGRVQTEYMSPESIERARKTSFKTGNIPRNHRPVGSERVLKEWGYIEVKILEPNVWKFKHRLVWEEHHGAIPDGANIQFRDGNPQNCSIENLYMITRAEQVKTENGIYAKYPKDLLLAIRAKGALKRQINKLKNNE